MRMLSPASSEYQVIRTYLDWILALPWHKGSGDEDISLDRVQEALDSRHYGLGEAKERTESLFTFDVQALGAPHDPLLVLVSQLIGLLLVPGLQ